MIAIVDYGMGNLRSVQKAIEHVGGHAVIATKERVLQETQGVILPGVGAFGNAMENLRARQLVQPIRQLIQADRPFLGICLGMQLLFEESEELGRHQGLGLLRGQVRRFPSSEPHFHGRGKRRVPHVGWNQIQVRQQSPLLAGIGDGSYAYFVHSYYVAPAEEAIVLASTAYGITYPSIVGQGNVFGVQFHPEKSQEIGLQVLRNFVQVVEHCTETAAAISAQRPPREEANAKQSRLTPSEQEEAP